MKRVFYCLFAVVLFAGCTEKVPDSNVRTTDFFHLNREIGWRLKIPVGYEINDASEIYENNRKGIEVTENATGQKIDSAFMQSVFGFQLDSSNLFQSIVAESEFLNINDWSANNGKTKHLFYLLYQEQGVNLDTTITSIETVGGLDFETYSLELLNNKKEVVMYQVFYSTLIHGMDFSVNIVGDSKKGVEKMKGVWKTSTFK